MQIAAGISQLLTWQWVALVAIAAFYRPIARFLDRLLKVRVGKEGITAEASLPEVPEAGELVQPGPQVGEVRERIETRYLVLRDSSGKKRAELGTTDTDSALLQLYDGDGRPRVALYAGKTGASVLSFENEQGEPRVMLASSDAREGAAPEEVVTGFSIRSRKDKIAVSLLVDAGGNPAFDLYSPSGLSLFNAQ
jgi:hypothetical protein